MIIRKPTKIELKPEQDQFEYDDYKKKQMESARNNKNSGYGLKDDRMSQSKIIEESGDRSRMNHPNEFYRTPNNLTSNLSFDREDRSGSSVPANQLFSTLLNNISTGGQHSADRASDE